MPSISCSGLFQSLARPDQSRTILESLLRRAISFHRSDEKMKRVLEKLRSKKGMQKILMEMAQETSDGYHYLAPWKLFEPFEETIESRSEEVKEALTKILRRL